MRTHQPASFLRGLRGWRVSQFKRRGKVGARGLSRPRRKQSQPINREFGQAHHALKKTAMADSLAFARTCARIHQAHLFCAIRSDANEALYVPAGTLDTSLWSRKRRGLRFSKLRALRTCVSMTCAGRWAVGRLARAHRCRSSVRA